MKPTYLYIKQHEITGMKYFGKTTKSDPIKYKGSGKHWKRHIKKHGIQYVKTLWYKLFTDKDELMNFALNFSKQNDIVNSPLWLNLKEENGLDGGMEKGFWDDDHLIKNSISAKERHASGHYDYKKMAEMRKGYKQPQSQKDAVSRKLSANWMITSPEGIQQTITNLRKFCIENNLDQGNLSRGKHKGWKAIKSQD